MASGPGHAARPRGRPPTASGRSFGRAQILHAALQLIDRGDGLTMRRLADELGVTPMAFYNHFRGKAEVLDGVADLLAREIAAPDPSLAWDERLRRYLTEVRRVCLAHPNAVPLLQSTRATTPALLRPMEVALDALAEAGLPPTRALDAWSALIGLTMGHIGYQLGGHLSRRGFDFDDAFEFALDSLVAGLARPRD